MRAKPITLTGGVLAMVLPSLAVAQSSPPSTVRSSENSPGLADIVVTAQRREERLQDVPIAVTAFSSDFVRKNIADVQDVAIRTPAFTAFGIKSQTSLAMRGAASLIDGPGSDQGVALFVDDVYIGENSGLIFDFFDVERIEVLRGPQGTLFGRNVVGGAINVVTRAPTEAFNLMADITIGNYGRLDSRGMIGGGLTDGVSGLFSYSVKSSNGWARNLTTGHRLEQDDIRSFRGKLKFDLADNFTMLVQGEYSRDKSYGSAAKLLDENLEPINGFGIPPGTTDFAQTEDSRYDRESYGGQVRFDLAGLPFGTITSISAYRHANNGHFDADSDGVPFPVYLFSVRNTRFRQFTQELRVAGDTDSFNWVAGLYYLRSKNFRREEIEITGLPGSPVFQGDPNTDPSDPNYNDPNNPPAVDQYEQTIRTRSYAAFGQVTYTVSDKLHLTAGARYTKETKKGLDSCLTLVLSCSEIYVDAPLSASFSAFTPKGTIAYNFAPDIMVYATVSRGFKSGGFISPLGSLAATREPFRPETAWNYELGFKSMLFDRRLQFNATAYQVDYDDLQVQTFNAQSIQVGGNAGTAKVRGIELDIQARPVKGLDLFATFAYTDSKYRDLILDGQDFSGNQLVLTPKYAVSVGGAYTIDMGSGSLELRGDYTHKSVAYLEPTNAPYEAQYLDGLANARLTYRSAGGNYEISGWVRNLTNNRALSRAVDLPILYFSDDRHAVTAQYTPPRTYGVTLTYRH